MVAMKLMTRHTRLFLWFIPPMALVAWLGFFLHPTWLIDSSYLNWLALAACLLILLTPMGSDRLETATSPLIPYSTVGWVSRSLVLQLGVWFLILGMRGLLDWHHPNDAPVPIDAWRQSLTQPLLHFGLFPFATITFLAVAFGRLSYLQGLDTYFDTLCFGNATAAPEALRIAIRTLGRALTLSGIALSAALSALALATLAIGANKVALLQGLTLPAFSAAFLLLLISLRRSQNPLLTAVAQQRPALGLLLNVIVWAFLLAVMAIIVTPRSSTELTPPNSWVALISEHWLDYPALFTVISSWLLIPLAGLFMARLAYGRTCRQLVLLGLLPSALLAGAVTQPWFRNPYPHAAWLVIIGFCAILLICLPRAMVPLTSQTYLAPGEAKHRNEMIFLSRWKPLTGMMFYFLIPGGLIALSVLYSLIVVPCCCVLLLTLFNLLRTYRRKPSSE